MQEPPPNLYAKHYVSHMQAPRASAEPRIFRGQDRVEDYQTLLEDGYDLLGYSAFTAGDVPPDALNTHAAQVHADLVLVYTTVAGEAPASVKLDQARSKAEKAEDSRISPDAPRGTLHSASPFYNYFASYWTKLPTPLLGVHVKQDGEAGKTGSGLEVIAVIKGSPAAVAGIQKGDTLLKLGDTELTQPVRLTQAAQRYAGQRTDIVYSRMGVPLREAVLLNAASAKP
jgi:hypothetical protein